MIYDKDDIYIGWSEPLPVVDLAKTEKLKTKRGISVAGQVIETLFTLASVEETSQALLRIYPAAKWEPDAMNRIIDPGQEGFFIYRLQGHTWSQIRYCRKYYDRDTVYRRNIAPALSQHLNSRVINYSESDTVCIVDYEVYDCGIKVEIEKDENRDALKQFDELLKREDAFEASISPSMFWSTHRYGKNVFRVINPIMHYHDGGWKRADYPIERVDFVMLQADT